MGTTSAIGKASESNVENMDFNDEDDFIDAKLITQTLLSLKNPIRAVFVNKTHLRFSQSMDLDQLLQRFHLLWNQEGFDSIDDSIWTPDPTLSWILGMNQMLQKPKFYNGQVAIVAVNVHLGYNQEDSIVMNCASLERGMFRTEHTISCMGDVENNDSERRRKSDDVISFGKTPSKIGRVDCLEDDGFPYIGANMHQAEQGDIVNGKCTPSVCLELIIV